ncbi:hypothetical protein [Blastopirellula marina]|uniref:HAMP domain-containing protein n=1 Tax=Blastopirellula marina TaxID=124 RepID=A0A2S8GDA8_9BACT|nr:hypothetical protein [Blastopirellula marina]PQO42445.1 hypothetical protein C5Y93_29400 [Blastopirellula marina]
MLKRAMPQRRRQFWVDPETQGKLVLRVILYWLVCLCSVGLVLMLIAALGEPRSPFNAASTMLTKFYLPAALASLLVLPVIVIDSIRHSNRFAGSAVRFQQAMQRLADGETGSPLVVRKGDRWKRLADHFNRIALRLEELENAQQPQADTAPSENQDEAVTTTTVSL